MLTLWSTVLLEKLPISQLVKKFLAFYGTRGFVTAFTSSRHLSLSGASLIRSISLFRCLGRTRVSTRVRGFHCKCFVKGCVLRYGVIIIIIIIIVVIVDVSCHRPFLPGTSLEPTVIPTAQASSFTLQYFPYCV